MTHLDMTADIIDLRDITDRVDELRNDRDSYVLGAPNGTETEAPELWAENESEDAEELEMLENVLSQLRGYGGDHQWEGDWYPQMLIEDTHFETYAEELAYDIGAVDRDAPWPASYIDWEAAAKALQNDYSTVEIDGLTYWYR